MKKPDAILLVNAHVGDIILTNQNTCFSSINKSKDVWWFNIPPEKFSIELHLLLKGLKSLIWLKIPANSFPDLIQTFRYRTDKNAIDLEISSNKLSRYLQDIKSAGTGYNFNKYFENEFTYNT